MSSPSRVASDLRKIANQIDLNGSPSKEVIRAGLKKVLFSLTREDRVRKLASDMVRLAQEEVELTSWDTEEGKDVSSSYDAARQITKDEKLVPALNSLKHDVDTMIKEIKSPGSKSKADDAADEDVQTSAPKRRDL